MTTVVFKEWLPDIPPLNHPALTDARNVEPINKSFAPFSPLAAVGSDVLSGRPIGYVTITNNLLDMIYAGTATTLAVSTSGAAFTALSAATYNPSQIWDFARFEDLVIATNGVDLPQKHTIGSTSNFTTLGSTSGTAPAARFVGRINQFVMLGDIANVEYYVRWSGLGLPASWPTPNSATAVAQQASEQYLDAQLGGITGITDGDQFGLIFQKVGITRVTYVGPPVVFQFDKISDRIGSPYPRSIVQVGSRTFFISTAGFFATDGVNLIPIGEGKVNNWFRANSSNENPHRIIGAVDAPRNLIYWTFPPFGAGSPFTPTIILIYNYVEDRFSWANQTNEGVIDVADLGYNTPVLRGFGAAFTVGTFAATVGSTGFPARIETGFIEITPGGRTFVDGIKPIVQSEGFSNLDFTVQLMTLPDNSTDVTTAVTTAAITANARTGWCNFRSDSKFHAARVSLPGDFDYALSMDVAAQPSGGA